MKIKNKTAGHAGIACFSFALKGNRAGSPHFKIVRFKWWEHVTHDNHRLQNPLQHRGQPYHQFLHRPDIHHYLNPRNDLV